MILSSVEEINLVVVLLSGLIVGVMSSGLMVFMSKYTPKASKIIEIAMTIRLAELCVCLLIFTILLYQPFTFASLSYIVNHNYNHQ